MTQLYMYLFCEYVPCVENMFSESARMISEKWLSWESNVSRQETHYAPQPRVYIKQT